MQFAIAFCSEAKGVQISLVEAASQDEAVRQYFDTAEGLEYSKDPEGFGYFLDDFNDPDCPQGAALQV
jgi:hypothetical protein